MAKIIAVTGASGTQGGGVLNVMRNTPGWQVRAITRDPGSDACKALAEQGIEIVQANFDDEESLKRAFEGVEAVFAVTNWWEHLFRGKTPDEAGELEEHQGMNIARAAAGTKTLNHFIWSTCPSARKESAGRLSTPHTDYKARVDERIKEELPELAAKTTYLYVGYYPSNLFMYSFLKPYQLVGLPLTPALDFAPFPSNLDLTSADDFMKTEGGPYVLIVPIKPDAKILNSGDMNTNPGIWVRQVLATGFRAFGKYANVALEKLSYKEMLASWSEVMGKPAILIECSVESYAQLWGPPGAEIALQFQYRQLCDPWAEREDFVSPEEMGINIEEVVGFRGAIESLKARQ